MNISDAINIFLHQSIIYGGLPFSVKLDKPNEETIAAIKEVDDMASGKIPSSPQRVDDFFKDMGV